MAASDTIDQARRLDEIGFPEFTAKLINSTFEALIVANLRQVESYIEGHSDAKFTHGICEECADKRYGSEDWYESMKAR